VNKTIPALIAAAVIALPVAGAVAGSQIATLSATPTSTASAPVAAGGVTSLPANTETPTITSPSEDVRWEPVPATISAKSATPVATYLGRAAALNIAFVRRRSART
jgi:hypothetical protein